MFCLGVLLCCVASCNSPIPIRGDQTCPEKNLQDHTTQCTLQRRAKNLGLFNVSRKTAWKITPSLNRLFNKFDHSCLEFIQTNGN